MPKKNRTVITREAYTLAVVDGKHAELTMYGDIVETRPIDWWTDKPAEGNFITQDEFLEDLASIKGADDLTIHLNSCGGDAYVSLAIHNRLRELADNGMNITCIVDGAAMSGGSLIMCAADTVKVNPSSLIMIHDCWSFAWDRFNSTKLRKLAEDLDVINESQAEIYVRKTGMATEEIRAMMAKETMMTGRKAKDLGFADELLEKSDSDIEVSADRKSLYVHGRRMKVAAMAEMPKDIPVHKEVETDPETDGGDIENLPESTGKNEGGIHMTLEELRQSDPEVAEALLAEAQASVSHDEAIAAERQRIADIDDIASLYDAETVRAAKYGNPCTAQEMAFRAAVEMAKQGKTFASNLASDIEESGANSVSPAPAGIDSDKPMSSEDRKAAGKAMAAKLRGEKIEEV